MKLPPQFSTSIMSDGVLEIQMWQPFYKEQNPCFLVQKRGTPAEAAP